MLKKLIALVKPAPTVVSILSPLTKIKDELAAHAENQVALHSLHTDNAQNHLTLAEAAIVEADEARANASVLANLFVR